MFDFNIDNLMDKTFHSYRRSKTHSVKSHYKWNPFNMVNKHFMRNSDQVYDLLMDGAVPKRIFQARPSLVLNIGNEYLTMMLMEELKKYYDHSSLSMPQRQIFTRFVRDMKQFTLPTIDYCHYTVPLTTSHSNGFVFPGEYVGQYGVYEAVKHVYERTESMKELLYDEHILVNKRYFAADMEKAIGGIRTDFRAKNGID